MSGDRRRHVKWRAALCKRIDSPAYDMWIEALVKLNDTYIGSKPYNAVDLIDKAYSRTSNRTTACAVGFGLWRRIDWGNGADSVADCRRTGVYLMEEGREIVSELMLENLGAKIPKSQNKTCSALLQTAATGELERGYREIVQVLQGNPFGPTVKSLRGYREIA